MWAESSGWAFLTFWNCTAGAGLEQQGLARWCSHLLLHSGRGAAAHPCAKPLKEKLPANRLNTNCSLERRISVNPVVSEENTEGFACRVNMRKHFSSLHGSTDFVSTLPTEINQFTRGQTEGTFGFEECRECIPRGIFDLFMVFCFWSVCVCVLQGLGILEIRVMGTRLWYCTEYSWNIRIRIWSPFNAFPKHPQEAQSLIYHSMSSPFRTGWGFMGGQGFVESGGADELTRMSGRAGNGKPFLPD